MLKINKDDLKTSGRILFTVFSFAIVYILSVYFFVFRPSFMRKAPSEKANAKYYLTEENARTNKIDTQWFLDQNPQEISITSFDGLKLSGLLLTVQEAKGTFILMHGYHSDPLREFSTLARFYNSIGYNVLLPYQRAHGKSEGKYITFGVKERYDLRDWIFKINTLVGNENPVYLHGISMGCATTLMVLGFELPDNVQGAVADCGFTSPAEIIWKVLKKDKKLPTSNVIFNLGNFMAHTFAGFDFNDYSTLTALKSNKRPVLFIHGTEDDFVPIEMTISNYQFCTSHKELYLVEKTPHAISNLTDKDNYQKNVIDFFNLCSNE